ncbi:FAD-dependent oxidoreductase [bacterium]|nr:FAD-dependent oxidoreductase [bacterium]
MTLLPNGTVTTVETLVKPKSTRRQPNLKFYDTVVREVINESPTVKLFELEFAEPFQFKAGQFVQLDLPIDSEVSRRSYSISSPPKGDNRIQLCVVLEPNGLGTPYLFEEVKVGDVLKTSQPLGRYVLPDSVEEELCFICTGVGIAPFRSMLLDAFNRDIVKNDVYLFFGNRRTEDILYRSEWEQMDKELPLFHFHPVLSRDGAPQWNGLTGYVHEHYLRCFHDSRPATFYLCGWRDMLNEARSHLAGMGYDYKQIKIEVYN